MEDLGNISAPIEIMVPAGSSSSPPDQSEDAKRRKEIADRLLRGEEVSVTPAGNVAAKDDTGSGAPAIVVPPGKLAASFYWYERDAELYRNEIEGMRRFFPQFNLEKLQDGRLSWVGSFQSNLRAHQSWYLQAVYQHNHPNNSTYGGSISVYSIRPDLKTLRDELGFIPHILQDSSGELYLCTSGSSDFRATHNYSTTAASALAWAAKWIAAFELWTQGDITTAEFAGHRI